MSTKLHTECSDFRTHLQILQYFWHQEGRSTYPSPGIWMSLWMLQLTECRGSNAMWLPGLGQKKPCSWVALSQATLRPPQARSPFEALWLTAQLSAHGTGKWRSHLEIGHSSPSCFSALSFGAPQLRTQT